MGKLYAVCETKRFGQVKSLITCPNCRYEADWSKPINEQVTCRRCGCRVGIEHLRRGSRVVFED